MAKILKYGDCTDWEIIENEEGGHALRCATSKEVIPVQTDAEGGLVIPELTGLEFVDEE